MIRCHQHPELNRLIGAIAVSKQFRRTLLEDPRQAVGRGCQSCRFDLTAEEMEAVVSAAAVGDARRFSLLLWEWMNDGDRQSDRNSGEEPCQIGFPLEGASFRLPVSTTSIEESGRAHHVFVSMPTLQTQNGRMGMNALILIVENERELARGLQFALEGEGYRVTLAWDAEAALGLLEQERPDLILADLRLPGMDGYALLRLVKQDDRWRDVPFVFVTAAADWRNAVQAKAMGADEYIVKPFDLDDFIAIVNRLAGVRAEAELPGDLNGGDAQD